MSAIFSIGHSNHSSETFLDLLRRHEITALADVRSIPYSRRHSQFRRETLAETLRVAGIAYVYLGAELGGRRPGLSLNEIGRTPEFRVGLSRLCDGAMRHRVAFMCAEREPLDCHRTMLVARHLKGGNLAIQHILADGSLESQEAMERRLVAQMGTAPLPLMARDPDAWREAVERAYEARARRWNASLRP